MKKLMALLLTGCMLAATLVGCGAKEATAEAPAAVEAESDLAYVKDKGVLVVGITDFAPIASATL